MATGLVYFFQIRSVGGAVADVPPDATAFANRDANFSVVAFGTDRTRLDEAWEDLYPASAPFEELIEEGASGRSRAGTSPGSQAGPLRSVRPGDMPRWRRGRWRTPAGLRPALRQAGARDGTPNDQVHELGVDLFPGEPAAVEKRPEQGGGHSVAVRS
jgi:hypothetical protein